MMRVPSAAAATAALLFATCSWGSLFLVGKPIVGVLDAVWFTVIRYALASALLLVLVWRFGQSPAAKLRAAWPRLTAFGVAGYGCFSVLVFIGLARSLPSHGSVIMATMPFTTMALRWGLDGVRPPAKSLFSAAVALAGVATVSGLVGGGVAVDPRARYGDLLTLAGTVGWVVYTRGAASLPDHSPLEYTALTAIAALPWLLAAALLATALGLVPSPSLALLGGLWRPLAYVAIVPTVAAALAFNFGVRRLGAAAGTLFLNVVPVSVLAVRALLGTPPRAGELLGVAMVAAALAIHAWPARAGGLPAKRLVAG
jgi:drug/metabolite transporter (DMT)-like permease